MAKHDTEAAQLYRDRQKRYRDKLRADLLAELGGECANCHTKDELEFDHVEPVRDDLAKLGSNQRLWRYRREAAEGKLQLLCRQCNASKSDRPEVQQPLPVETEVPF